MSPPSRIRPAWPRSARSAISWMIVESGQYFVRPGPSNWSHAPVAAVSACSPASGLRSRCARTTLAGGHAAPGEPLDELEAHRAVLRVHAHRRADAGVRLRRGGERPRLEGGHGVVARADLDDPAAAELGGEAVGQRVLRGGAQRVVLRVVRVAVQAGGADDVQAGLAGDALEAVEVAAEADRRPVDERRAASRGDERRGSNT